MSDGLLLKLHPPIKEGAARRNTLSQRNTAMSYFTCPFPALVSCPNALSTVP